MGKENDNTKELWWKKCYEKLDAVKTDVYS
jgi:hypothetical protein